MRTCVSAPGITDGSMPPGSRISRTYAAVKAGCICVRSLGGHSRRVIGSAMGPRQDTDLVVTALTHARAIRGSLPEQVILHADRGVQFTSHQLDEAAREVGLRMSMGKTGVCWDNAMAESFWATLKVEYFYRHAFATRAEVYDGVSEWIEVFYNRYRRHSAIGFLSPVAYELSLDRATAALIAA